MNPFEPRYCIDCNVMLGPRDGRKLCCRCSPVDYSTARHRERQAARPKYQCQRCDTWTYRELNAVGECTVCQKREPDPTIEEIYAMAAEIRAQRGPEWQMD